MDGETIQTVNNGLNSSFTETISFPGLESAGKEKAEFQIRPLTSGELTQLQTLEKRGFQVKVGMQNGKRQTVESNLSDVDINVGEFNEYQAEAMYTAIAWSLNVDVEEIKELPVGIPELLFEKVIEISSLSDKDLTAVKTFRKKE